MRICCVSTELSPSSKFWLEHILTKVRSAPFLAIDIVSFIFHGIGKCLFEIFICSPEPSSHMAWIIVIQCYTFIPYKYQQAEILVVSCNIHYVIRWVDKLTGRHRHNLTLAQHQDTIQLSSDREVSQQFVCEDSHCYSGHALGTPNTIPQWSVVCQALPLYGYKLVK